jgi:hypothetical protein
MQFNYIQMLHVIKVVLLMILVYCNDHSVEIQFADPYIFYRYF